MEKIDYSELVSQEQLDSATEIRAQDMILRKQILAQIEGMQPIDIIQEGLEIYYLENGLFVYFDKADRGQMVITPERDFKFEQMIRDAHKLYITSIYSYEHQVLFYRLDYFKNLALHLNPNSKSEYTFNRGLEIKLNEPLVKEQRANIQQVIDFGLPSVCLSNDVEGSRFFVTEPVSEHRQQLLIDQLFYGEKSSSDEFKTLIDSVVSGYEQFTEQFGKQVEDFTSKIEELRARSLEQDVTQTEEYKACERDKETYNQKAASSKAFHKMGHNSRALGKSIYLQTKDSQGQMMSNGEIEHFALKNGMHVYACEMPYGKHLLCSASEITDIDKMAQNFVYNTKGVGESIGDSSYQGAILSIHVPKDTEYTNFVEIHIKDNKNQVISISENGVIGNYSSSIDELAEYGRDSANFETNLEDALKQALEQGKAGFQHIPEEERKAMLEQYQELYSMLTKEREKVQQQSSKEQQSIEEEPTAKEPVAEEPSVEEPVVEELVAEESVAEEPVAEEPAVEELVAEEPAVEEPVAEEPVEEEPTAKEQAAEESSVEEPNEYSALTLEQLGTEIQSVDIQVNALKTSIINLKSISDLPGIQEQIDKLNISLSELESKRNKMQQAENLVAGENAKRIQDVIKNLVGVVGQEAIVAGLQAQVQALHAKYPEILKKQSREPRTQEEK